MTVAPALPRRPDDPELLKGSPDEIIPTGPAFAADLDARRGDLRPPDVEGAVPHDQIRVDEFPGDAELDAAAVESLCGSGQRAVRHRDRSAADDVVDDLVSDEDPLGVRPDVAVDRNPEDPLTRRQFGVGCRQELRLVDRGDPVVVDAAVDVFLGEALDVVAEIQPVVPKRDLAVPVVRFRGCLGALNIGGALSLEEIDVAVRLRAGNAEIDLDFRSGIRVRIVRFTVGRRAVPVRSGVVRPVVGPSVVRCAVGSIETAGGGDCSGRSERRE